VSEGSERPDVHPAVPPQADDAKPQMALALGRREKAPAPTLSAYFGEKRTPAASFVKAIRASRLTSFEQADYSAALALMHKNDPDGERLWKLLSQRHLPEALKSWVWSAARERLVSVIGSGIELVSQTPEQLVDLFRKRFGTLPSRRNKAEQSTFLSSVRIAASWLLQKQGLQAWEVVRLFSGLLCRDEHKATQITSTAIRSGSSKELNLAASVIVLDRRNLQDHVRERDRAKAEASDLREHLERKVAEIAKLSATLQDLHEQNIDLSTSLTTAKRQLDTERQHSGYDFTELKASNAILLRDRLSPLIRDAIDALEIANPAPDVARRRLKKAISTIEESLP